MEFKNLDFAIIVPMANEEGEFSAFITQLSNILDQLKSGKVYLIVDKVSKDKTLALCQNLSEIDKRYICVWAPENKNVVDAYLRGYVEALKNKHPIIIEMDAGLSHDPIAIPLFLNSLNGPIDCAFGSRFIKGGGIHNSNWKRYFLSIVGTVLTNILLGTKLNDMTSGYQGFKSNVVQKFVEFPLLSKAHFYQTELRYLLREFKFEEIPIYYQSPSPSVSKSAIKNSIEVLFYYFKKRIFGNPIKIY